MDARDVALGLAVTGSRAAVVSGRVVLAPARVAARLPGIGRPLHGAAAVLAADGIGARARVRLLAETLAAQALAAPELERAIDRALAGPLTDAVARSIAEHRVAERVASQVVAELDLERLIAAVLEDERTELALD